MDESQERKRSATPEDSGPDVATIKKERTESGDEIKEYAETAMNELLGCWYGTRTTEERHGHSGCDSSGPESPSDTALAADSVCGWCGRRLGRSPSSPGALVGAVTSTGGGGSFCSELCFSQSRRATFKRNKTCDWCRHVRHTVAYVDIREDARQLQFCSDKCLNQYKMHIFCRETRAHLELHPHLQHRAPHSDESPLITPEMWMRDCGEGDVQRGRHVSPSPECPSPSLAAAASKRRHAIRNVNRKSMQASQAKRRNTRSSTITSTEEASVLSSDGPQDLRVRPREQLKPAKLPTVSNPEVHQNTRHSEHQHHPIPPPPPPMDTGGGGILPPSWLRQPLPPITVLVPYPIIIPLPLPIPIPIPMNMAKMMAREEMEVKLPPKEEPKPPPVVVTAPAAASRTLRKRNRPGELVGKAATKTVPV